MCYSLLGEKVKVEKVFEKPVGEKGDRDLSFVLDLSPHKSVRTQIAKTSQISRGRLSEKLKIGEGATHTLIERLKDADLFSVSSKGFSITAKGEKVWTEFQSTFPQKANLNKNDLERARRLEPSGVCCVGCFLDSN